VAPAAPPPALLWRALAAALYFLLDY
jgi:hypothetical protein